MSNRDRLRLSLEESQLNKSSEADNNDLQQSEHMPPSRKPDSMTQSILNMQRTHGNQAVRRMIANIQRSSLMDGGPISSDLSDEINSKRGGGSALDSQVQAEMSQKLGRDFGDVSVHTDSQSDTLNKSLGAKAFTTGQDIFFSQGAYQPGSDEGKRLLSHELTHVIHQDGSNPSGDLTLGPANDSYEQEADHVADAAMSTSEPATAQAKLEDVQREEEEEMLQSKRDPDIQREEEEEMLQAKRDPDIQREEEEEMLQAKRDPAIQREEMPEEEMMS
jgi:hypothetical protein